MEGFRKGTWQEFYDAPGVLEAMNTVFEKTGWTILIHHDMKGTVKKAYPVQKTEK